MMCDDVLCFYVMVYDVLGPYLWILHLICMDTYHQSIYVAIRNDFSHLHFPHPKVIPNTSVNGPDDRPFTVVPRSMPTAHYEMAFIFIKSFFKVRSLEKCSKNTWNHVVFVFFLIQKMYRTNPEGIKSPNFLRTFCDPVHRGHAVPARHNDPQGRAVRGLQGFTVHLPDQHHLKKPEQSRFAGKKLEKFMKPGRNVFS